MKCIYAQVGFIHSVQKNRLFATKIMMNESSNGDKNNDQTANRLATESICHLSI